jgi:CheY-like chemotaxis protein
MLDISMPVMNGSKATRQIRTRASATAVLIVMPHSRDLSRAPRNTASAEQQGACHGAADPVCISAVSYYGMTFLYQKE